MEDVLLLDVREFQRPALEALRHPLEDGVVSVARAPRAGDLPSAVAAHRDDGALIPLRRCSARFRSSNARVGLGASP